MMVVITEFFAVFAATSISYFVFVNSAYLLLIFGASIALTKITKSRPIGSNLVGLSSSLAPSISILAPAYNEQETVVESVKSFLALNYPSFEVVVINDGSKDETLARLIEAFSLKPTDLIYDSTLSPTPVRQIYQSFIHPNLFVVDKANGGKADALNVGLGVCQYDIFCAVDSDSLLEGDSLTKVALPFLEDPERVIATGGTVRIANGTSVKFGRVETIGLPNNWLVLMQIIEYTRAFLCGRIGWNVLNATLVISGAFGLFSKKAVKSVGGYLSESIGEDMELILRLHKYHRRNKIPYSIVFVPDPVCWTEAPADVQSLGKQRDRWQRGLADTLLRHREMIFNPRYGVLGMIALPYFLFVELLGPVFEAISILVILGGLLIGGYDPLLLKMFFVASLLYGAILSLAALLIEEVFFSKYSSARQFLALLGICLIESLWFRQLSSWWRLKGLFKFIRGDHTWGHLTRAGFTPKVKIK